MDQLLLLNHSTSEWCYQTKVHFQLQKCDVWQAANMSAVSKANIRSVVHQTVSHSRKNAVLRTWNNFSFNHFVSLRNEWGAHWTLSFNWLAEQTKSVNCTKWRNLMEEKWTNDLHTTIYLLLRSIRKCVRWFLFQSVPPLPSPHGLAAIELVGIAQRKKRSRWTCGQVDIGHNRTNRSNRCFSIIYN